MHRRNIGTLVNAMNRRHFLQTTGTITLAMAVSSPLSMSPAEDPNAFAVNKLIGRGVNIGGALDTPKTEGECNPRTNAF
jgi:hypothetical protein